MLVVGVVANSDTAELGETVRPEPPLFRLDLGEIQQLVGIDLKDTDRTASDGSAGN